MARPRRAAPSATWLARGWQEIDFLADRTCDSDGKIDDFIDIHDVKHSLELHPFKEDEPYYLSMFLPYDEEALEQAGLWTS